VQATIAVADDVDFLAARQVVQLQAAPVAGETALHSQLVAAIELPLDAGRVAAATPRLEALLRSAVGPPDLAVTILAEAVERRQ
jgi:hypothetical protein